VAGLLGFDFFFIVILEDGANLRVLYRVRYKNVNALEAL